MNKTMAKLVGFALLVFPLWNGTAILGQAVAHRLKLGKTDDITLTTVTKIGNMTLPPGHYILQHRTSHGQHAMHFVRFIPYGGGPGHGHTYYPTSSTGSSHAGEQACKLEPLASPAKETQAYLVDEDGTKRITRIEIKGETVAHVF